MSTATLKATATRLIAKWGRTVTITKVTPGTPTATPWMGSTPGSTTQSVKAGFLDPRNSEQNFDFANKLIPKTDIVRADWHVIVAAEGLAFVPAQGHTVTDTDGTVYKVVTVSPAAPGTDVFLYILQVQR